MGKRSDTTQSRHRQQEIVNQLCLDIYHGRLQPGEQLPPRTELALQYDTTGLTIQRAFHRLIESGHLETLPRQGTFIARTPPNLNRIGVVYHAPRGGSGWRGLDATLDEVVQDHQPDSHYEFVSYYGLEVAGNGARQQLIDDLNSHRLMGLLFAVAPDGLRLREHIESADVGKVAVQAPRSSLLAPSIAFDSDLLIPGMVDHLVEAGCRRIAVICHSQTPEMQVDGYLAALNKRGLQADPTWIQACSLSETRWAANTTRLLLRGNADERPDGLIITDDTLVEPVLTGIQQSECRVPEDLHVVAYCNFPLLKPDVLPIKRIGFDMGTVLTKGIQALEEQRLGTFTDQIVKIPCISQDDRMVAPTATELEASST